MKKNIFCLMVVCAIISLPFAVAASLQSTLTVIRWKGRNHLTMEYEIDVDVKFPESAVKASGATLYLRLEDITYADAPANLVVEVIVQDVSVPPSAPLRATLRVPQDRVLHNALYSVRAHLDVDSDGRVSVGDWISTQIHPVLTRGNPTQVAIPLKMVG